MTSSGSFMYVIVIGMDLLPEMLDHRAPLMMPFWLWVRDDPHRAFSLDMVSWAFAYEAAKNLNTWKKNTWVCKAKLPTTLKYYKGKRSNCGCDGWAGCPVTEESRRFKTRSIRVCYCVLSQDTSPTLPQRNVSGCSVVVRGAVGHASVSLPLTWQLWLHM